MKQYVLDEISRPDIPRIKAYLDEHAQPSGLEGIWWVDLAEDQLTAVQRQNPDYHPFCFAVELGRNFVKFEFLIRSRQSLRCPFAGYADRRQREWIMDYAEEMVARLGLRT